MLFIIKVLSWFLFLSLTISAHIHYKSYHFEYNDLHQWSTNIPISNDYQYTFPSQQLISCTINLPSLCIYSQTPNAAGFLLFYKDKMYDFLNDANWTKITVSTSVNQQPNININHIQRRRLKEGISGLLQLGRSFAGRGHHYHNNNRYHHYGHHNDGYRRRRHHGRRRRRRRRGRCGRRCGPRIISYLGPPHIIGPPQWILGGPLQKRTPFGFRRAGAFPMGLGSSPMYPGLMGGYPGVASPNMWPGTYHGVTGHAPYGARGLTMLGTIPDYNKDAMSNMMTTLGAGLGGVGSLGRGLSGMLRRGRGRRLVDDESLLQSRVKHGFYGSDVRVKKCVFVGDTEEVCAIYWYLDGSLTVEYNVLMDDMNTNDIDNEFVDYVEASAWDLSMDDADLVQCNEDLLAVDGYSVCIERFYDANEVNVMVKKDAFVHTMSFESEEGCDKIYENMDAGKKICSSIENIEMCLEIQGNKIKITAEKLWEDE